MSSVLYYKLKDIVLIILIAILSYFVVSNNRKLKKLNKQEKKRIESIIKKNDLIISEKNEKIKLLTLDNNRKQIQINKSKNTIDSLVLIKSKIRIMYYHKIREINNFDNEKILSYWNKEFNK